MLPWLIDDNLFFYNALQWRFKGFIYNNIKNTYDTYNKWFLEQMRPSQLLTN